MPDSKKPDVEFFDLLAEQNEIDDPFGDQEIFVKDASGKMTTVQSGKTPSSPSPSLSSPSPAPSASPATQVQTRVKVTAPPQGKPLDFKNEIETIIRLSDLSITDDTARKRLVGVIEAALRKVRSQLQTREILMSSPLVGGLGLTGEQADKLIALINQQSQQLEDKSRQAESTEQFADLQQEAQKILAQNPVPAKEIPTLNFATAKQEMGMENDEIKAINVAEPKKVQSIPVAQRPPAGQQVKVPVHVPPKQTQPKTPRPVIRSVIKPSPRPGSSSAKRIQDVKFSPRLMGPIDEIKAITLEDFRALAPTPGEAVDMIQSKIELLEDESFTKKIKAARAWKESAVNRLYLDIGDESMESKLPIDQVIARRQQQQQPAVTAEEFDAIMDLNSRLRY